MSKPYFNPEEKKQFVNIYRLLYHEASHLLSREELKLFRSLLQKTVLKRSSRSKYKYPLDPIIRALNTIYLAVHEIGLGRAVILSVAAYDSFVAGVITMEEIEQQFDASIVRIVKGLVNVHDVYKKTSAIETENFRKLLLTFAEDVRVIFVMIAERVYTLRNLNKFSAELQSKIAREASFLYAPLAHRLGLYKLKTELEDLSLKYISPEIYADIEHKLRETKVVREKYIEDFIRPLKEELLAAGFDFEIKGRTKSIFSIWNKIKKQNTPFEKIYDIFAIRIILNSPIEREKSECWQVYSIVTDKYQPNPKRMRDWLSIPKTNGYESLHTTVMGPEGKWVEVQIRTQRMDEIAEKGLAAHWKYKGIKGEDGMDEWLKHIREILENPELNAVDFMDDFKLDLYDDEVFVFTPNGDLQKLKKGATVLDFAFHIHSNLGAKCTGARVNDKNVPIRHVLKNGDQVEIQTGANQKPKFDWLNIVVTAKAKTRIKQALKEIEYKQAEQGRELLLRRLKNWKIEYSEADITRLTKKLGYKSVSDFYQEIALEKLELHDIREHLLNENESRSDAGDLQELRSANNFVREAGAIPDSKKEDVLVIDKNIKGIDYKLSKCCNPIYGDEVFGFVSSLGGIKIHRMDCPNAPQLIQRFGYRIVQARWSGKSGSQYPISLRVTGRDDIAIVTNISSLISKEAKVSLRSITVDSTDGVFQGFITVLVNDLNDLQGLVRKIKAVRGVTQVERTSNF